MIIAKWYTEKVYIVFDCGGTKLRLAASVDGQTITRKKVIPTPKQFSEGVQVLQAEIAALSEGQPLHSIVGGIAGVLQPDKKGLQFAPNLADWEDKPLVQELAATFRVPVFLQNDAALGALGEAVFGAGKDKKIVAYVAVGTGVGGARVVEGKIDGSSFGFEPGHHVMDAGKTFEQLVVGDQEKEKWLAQGLVNTALFWSPDIIVLGGSVVHWKEVQLPDVVSHFKAAWKMSFAPPPLVAAGLGDESGLYGGLAYGRTLG